MPAAGASLLDECPPGYVELFTSLAAASGDNTVDVPVDYVLSVDDVAMPPGEYGWAPRFPDRLGLTPVTAPGSHEALFTQPSQLASALLPRS